MSISKFVITTNLSLAAITIFLVLPAFPQQKCPGILGRVTSVDGWLIPDATVRLVNRKTKDQQRLTADKVAEYKVCLSPGTYDVFAESLGYKQGRRESIIVEKDGMNTVDLVLRHGKPIVLDERHP